MIIEETSEYLIYSKPFFASSEIQTYVDEFWIKFKKDNWTNGPYSSVEQLKELNRELKKLNKKD